MPRYLVVAHRTLGSPELLEALLARSADGLSTFHLLVPEYHGDLGLTYTDARSRAAAHHALEEARARFASRGITTTGEVGEASPIEAITTVLHREGPERFDAVILSTLPPGISRWLGLDLLTQVRRHHFGLDVSHVVGHVAVFPADASAAP